MFALKFSLLLAWLTWLPAEAFSFAPRKNESHSTCHQGLPKRVALVYHGEYYRRIKAVPHNIQTELGRGADEDADSTNLDEGDMEMPTICSNYFETADNIREMIIQPLEECGTQFITFFHSYRDSSRPCRDEKLVTALAPYKYHFDGNLLPRLVDTHIAALRIAQGELSNLRIDTVLLLRFDVKYRQKITDASIDWDAVNLAHRGTKVMWDEEKRVSDLFFLFPARYTENMIKALDTCSWVGHYVFAPLVRQIGSDAVHFVDPGYHASLTFENTRAWLGINRNCGDATTACA